MRLLPDGSLLCVRCFYPARDIAAGDMYCRDPRKAVRHAADPPPCGAPASASSAPAAAHEQVSCHACTALASASPAPPVHDLRIAPGAVACAACGRAAADLLTLGYCVRREGEQDGSGGFPRHAPVFAEGGDIALCGAAPPAAFAEGGRGFWASGVRPVACPGCMAAIEAMPSAAAVHDVRAAGGGAACAACALAAERPDALADEFCDKGVFRAAFEAVRSAGRVSAGQLLDPGRKSGVWRYANSSWSEHLPGCRHIGTPPDLTVFRARGARAGGVSRIACIPCLKRLDRLPPALS